MRFGMWFLSLLTILAGLLISPGVAQANDVYLAQNAAGSANGSSCANAYAVTYFNTSGNWTSGTPSGTKIGPGTTVHLCGTFTGPAPAGGAGNVGPNVLTFRGSGTSGSVITVLFESGAMFTAPVWGWGGVAAINLNSQSYILIDGGKPCGTTTGGVNAGPCNGVIQNTANGMSATYNQSSYAIEAQNTSNIEIRNLGIYNLYMHTAEQSRSSCSGEVDQTQVAAIRVDGSTTVSIHDNDMHDIGWAIPGVAFGTFQVYNNQIYNMDHGMAIGNSMNTNANGPLLIHDNHFGAMTNWDVEPANCDHHDGIHIWAQQNGNSGTVNNVYIYSNQFDGDPGTGMNDYVFIEQAVNNVYVFNNDMVPSGGSGGYCVGCIGMGTKSPSTGDGMFVFNNDIRAAASGYANRSNAYFSLTTTNAWINNLTQGMNSAVAFGINPGDTPTPCTSIGSISGCVLSNIYENLQLDGGSQNTFGYHSKNTASQSQWQTGSSYLNGNYGADSGARLLSPLSAFLLNSNGVPQTGSPVIQAGTNLTSLCTGNLKPLCSDKYGNPRPTVGNWDVGAYQASGSAPPPLSPPTNLTATAH